MDIKNKSSLNSTQRANQRRIDQPMLVYYSNNFTLFSNDTPAMPEIKEDEDAPAPPQVQKKAIPYASL